MKSLFIIIILTIGNLSQANTTTKEKELKKIISNHCTQGSINFVNKRQWVGDYSQRQYEVKTFDCNQKVLVSIETEVKKPTLKYISLRSISGYPQLLSLSSKELKADYISKTLSKIESLATKSPKYTEESLNDFYKREEERKTKIAQIIKDLLK